MKRKILFAIVLVLLLSLFAACDDQGFAMGDSSETSEISMGIFDRDCDWYCDNCDAHLNNQSGFTASSGTWECTECGYSNDVSEDNILTGDEEEFVKLAYVVCPRCSAHMTTEDYEHYECPDCGCTGTYDYDADTLIKD